MRPEFIAAIKANQSAFGIELSDDAIGRLADYYELILDHNPILHLVGPCSPEEFAIRHILESLTLLEYLPTRAKFADVGTGGGLPSIPCLLVREDLSAVLIESKEKKTKFLELAVNSLGLNERATVVNKQFQEVDLAGCQFITCRAIDKFTEKLRSMLSWSKKRTLILFAGNTLRTALANERVDLAEKLIPMSEQRFMFVVRPGSSQGDKTSHGSGASKFSRSVPHRRP